MVKIRVIGQALIGSNGMAAFCQVFCVAL